MKPVAPPAPAAHLLGGIHHLIESSSSQLAATINSALTLLFETQEIGQFSRKTPYACASS